VRRTKNPQLPAARFIGPAQRGSAVPQRLGNWCSGFCWYPCCASMCAVHLVGVRFNGSSPTGLVSTSEIGSRTKNPTSPTMSLLPELRQQPAASDSAGESQFAAGPSVPSVPL
jgi:hypothetical protein